MDAKEIIKEGILLKSKPLRQRCGSCDDFLSMEFYRYKGKVNRKIVRCKKCGTASWVNSKSKPEVRKIESI